MSIGPSGRNGAAPARTAAIPPGIAAADWRAETRLRAAIEDLFLPDDARLDDRLRAALSARLAATCRAIEAAVGQHAARQLMRGGAADLATALEAADVKVLERLIASGVLRDAGLIDELFGRVREELIAAQLPVHAPDEPDRPSLLAQLAGQADPVVATAAIVLMTAESQRRGTATGQPLGSDLPAELHHRLVWWVAAALRESHFSAAEGRAALLDGALTDAALRSAIAHDESDSVEAAAARLAAALDPQPEELPPLLIEALADRRLSLFIALLARALRIEQTVAREMVLDPVADRLWLALRALDVDRTTLARIGLALSDADPARDIEHFADEIDGIAAIAPADAHQRLAPLLLHRDYRAALLALASGNARR